MRYIAIVLLLASCAPVEKYTPRLISPPKDTSAFSADLDYCRGAAKAFQRNLIDTRACNHYGSFGLIGYAAASAGPKNDCEVTLNEKVDECMTQKGYKLVK